MENRVKNKVSIQQVLRMENVLFFLLGCFSMCFLLTILHAISTGHSGQQVLRMENVLFSFRVFFYVFCVDDFTCHLDWSFRP
jgi:predicted membrane channel-forming protein YqfA (hemolysin III family)